MMWRQAVLALHIPFFLILSFIALTAVADEKEAVNVMKLSTPDIVVKATPDIGGRILSFSLRDNPNFLRIGDEVKKIPEPEVSAGGANISYFGHEVWVGPQSAWWIHQTLNKQRAEAKAIWPPDAYLVLAKNEVVEQTANTLIFKGAPSLITGVQLTKRYQLVKDNPNQLKLNVQARNIRDTKIAWDIWFNTRVYADSHVYVPVSNEDDVRVNQLTNNERGPLTFHTEDGIFSLDITEPPVGKTMRLGKLMIQPSAGWMAAFRNKQVFIIQFPWQPLSLIHPEQGQIELYHDYQPSAADGGVLEMEHHAPYVTLAPNETMNAEELWTILPYKGKHNRAAHIDFLQQHAKQLGLEGL